MVPAGFPNLPAPRFVVPFPGRWNRKWNGPPQEQEVERAASGTGSGTIHHRNRKWNEPPQEQEVLTGDVGIGGVDATEGSFIQKRSGFPVPSCLRRQEASGLSPPPSRKRSNNQEFEAEAEGEGGGAREGVKWRLVQGII